MNMFEEIEKTKKGLPKMKTIEDEVEEESAALQKTDKKENLKKAEKDTNSKVAKVKFLLL